MALEDDFPGLDFEIKTLRANGLQDDEILRAIGERASFHQQAGHSGDAVNAWLKGRPGPITTKVDKDMPAQLQPRQMKELQDFEKSRSMPEGVDPMTGRAPGSLLARSLIQGGVGYMRGIADAALATGKTFMQEIQEAPEQFYGGIQKMVGKESSALERVLGGVEAAMAPVRAVSAPFTAVINPTYKRGIEPLLPEGMRHPVTEFVAENLLGLPFMAPAIKAARMPGELKAAQKVTSETDKGRQILARLAKEGKLDPEVQARVNDLAQAAEVAPEEKPTDISRRGFLGMMAKAPIAAPGIVKGLAGAVGKAPGVAGDQVIAEFGSSTLMKGPSGLYTFWRRFGETGIEGPEVFVEDIGQLANFGHLIEGEPHSISPVISYNSRPYEPAIKSAMESIAKDSQALNMLVTQMGTNVGALLRNASPELTLRVRGAVRDYYKSSGTRPEDMSGVMETFDSMSQVPQIVEKGSSIVDASQAAPEKVPLEKVDTPEGVATVVDKQPGEPTIVTKLPEDSGQTYAKGVEDQKAIVEGASISSAPEGFSPAQERIVVAHALAKKQGITVPEAMKAVEGIPQADVTAMAAQALREFRIATGEITGKRGRPKVPEALQLGETRTVSGFDPNLEAAAPQEGVIGEMAPQIPPLRERIRGSEVRLPERTLPGDVGIPQVGVMRRLADSKGYELVVQRGRVRVIKNGGAFEDFETLRDANQFLLTKEVQPKQPVELKSPETGESAIEAAIQHKKLTSDQQANVRRQAALQKNAKPLEQVGSTENPRSEFELAENQSLGISPMVVTRNEGLQVFAAARKSGFQSRLLRTSEGYEVAYYKEATPEVNRAISLYRKLSGMTELTGEEQAELGKALGSETKMPPISGGGSDAGSFRRMLNRFAARLSPDRESHGELRFANPMAGGMVSGSPLIRGATREMFWAKKAFDHRMEGFTAVMTELKKSVPDPKRAFELKEGTISPSNNAERAFLDTANSLTKDFARRAREQGMLKEAQELENYAPHVTDQQAMWSTFRAELMQANKLEDLSPAMRLKLTPGKFADFKDIFEQHANVDTVPKDILRRVRTQLMDMSDVSSEWGSLPDFIKDRLPREMFVQYFLPREGNKFVKKDFYGNMHSYISRVETSLNFSPWLKKYSPIIESLPGEGVPFTERGFLETLANNTILGRPTWDAKIIESLNQRLSLVVGRDLFKLNDVQAAVTLIRNGFLRGVLGPDSAAKHVMGLLNTWAESGRVAGPLFKYLQKSHRDKIPEGVLSEYWPQLVGSDIPADSPMLQKVLNIDKKFTQIVLSPETVVWNLTRGVSFVAGMEEAAAKGLNATDALKVGFARSSEVVPNLEMTEAQMKAIETVARQEVGVNAASRAPLLAARSPLGRISTALMTWPLHVTQFMQIGLRQGFADAMLKNEPAKLMRYMATVGFITSMPWMVSKLGGNVRDTWGPAHLLHLISFPFISSIGNVYRVATGQTPLEVEKASKEVKDLLIHLSIPQSRFGTKVIDVVDNINRGYGVDKRGRYMYESSQWGELLRLVGINPENAYQARTLSHTYMEMSHQYESDKQKAVDGILSGDFGPAHKYMSQWGRQINPQDIQKALQQRMTTPEQRALQGMPKDLRPMAMQEAQ